MGKYNATRRAEQRFGKIPDLSYYYGDMEHIREYFDYRRKNNMDEFLIDETTWYDLDMDDVFKRINACSSSSGEQYLYYELRSPSIDEKTYLERNRKIHLMEEQPALRLKLAQIISRIGRKRRADLSVAFSPSAHGPIWLVIYIMLLLFLLASVLYAIVTPTVGIILPIFSIALNGIIHEVRKRSCQRDFDAVNYTVSMVFALNRIKKLKNPPLDDYLEKPYENLKKLRSVIRTGGVLNSSVNTAAEFICTVLLLDLITYEFLKNKLGRCHDDIFAIHETIGQLDSAISVASYRKSVNVFAEPELDFSHEKPYISVKSLIHPLISAPVPNDLITSSSVLITGSNASGKSTYLKSALLCALMSQSICTCCAKSYRASAFLIYSSMSLKDDIFAGESYYIAETRSLKRIMDRMNASVPLLCAIDEVLRGTNTVERIAASSTLLKAISESGTICIAATHDIELCALLNDSFALYHFEEQVGEDEMLFDYRIRPGKAESRNAINLLRLMGFDDEIVSDAHTRANEYIKTGMWK